VQYERLLALDPKDLEALLAAGAVAEQAGRWTEADDFYRRAAALDPGRVDVWQRRIDLHSRRGERAAALTALKEAQDAGAAIRYDDAQFVGMARLMEAEAADIVAAATAQTEDGAAPAPVLTEVGALQERSDTLALAAQGLVAPEPLVVGHRHRVLALHQLNESTYELLRYAETRERERLGRSRLLRDAAQKELAKARELDADAGWPIVTAEEPGGAAGSPAP
jgi:tetratricopeptide (TPR) repeat protein